MGCGQSVDAGPTSVEGDRPARNTQNSRKTVSRKHTENGSVIPVDVHAEKAKTGEEPKAVLEDGDIGDCRLGLLEYELVMKRLDELPSDELFCDPDFPADETTLFYNDPDAPAGVQWARPKDLVEPGQQPYLLVDGLSRHDIMQGELGDCWFLSSCAAVSVKERFMKKIVPAGQPLFGEGYRGMVRFCFWRYGEWVDVYIDDRLPLNQYGQLRFARCHDPTEFWVPLIEKAYAKLHGSYQAVEGGNPMDALVDLTGGVAERYELQQAPSNLYRHMFHAYKSNAFITCSRKGSGREEVDESVGLVSGHAYSITNVAKVKAGSQYVDLLRVRNPWGNEVEWKGAWSDGDGNWSKVHPKVREKLDVQRSSDGEFWMSFEDFGREFQEIAICTVGPDLDGDGDADSSSVACVEGSWQLGYNAGGCRNDMDKFCTNPQFLLSLYEADDPDPEDYTDVGGKCCVVISLMQEHRRSQKHLGVKMLELGYLIYKAPSPARLPSSHFRYNYETAKSGTYINLREISNRFELEPGHYIIVPSTFGADEAGAFMLRVFAAKNFTVTQV